MVTNVKPVADTVTNILAPMIRDDGQAMYLKCQRAIFGRVSVTSALPPIVLENSSLGCVQNFLEALVRALENHVSGHMIDPISNRLPS